MASPAKPASVPRREQRATARFTLILRAGKLACDAGQFLCVLHDASSGGVKARLFHPLPDCAQYELELGTSERYRMTRVWQRGDWAGFRFAQGPIDIDTLLAETGPFPKRAIRLQLALAALVHTDQAVSPVQLRDISQHGALVSAATPLALGQPVRLECAGLPVLHGRVRWRRGAAHGLVFQEGFRLDELARLAARVQLEPAVPPAPGEPRIPASVNQ